MDAAGDKVMKELRDVVSAAEELLAAAGSENAERLKEIRDRTATALQGARERLEGAGEEIEERVRKHPYAALGIAAGVGLIVGILLSRK
jgi:ElaB/YqjD/DUF883 family membrane-anchored ribosome-binding protein